MIRELLTKRDAMSQTIYFINYTKVHLGFWGFDSEATRVFELENIFYRCCVLVQEMAESGEQTP